jgi:CBS domain-containing protein
MTKELYVVKPEATVDECISLMTEKRVRHLPVLEKESCWASFPSAT